MNGRPNVVLITVDSLRADRLLHFGGERSISPELDDLAVNSLRARSSYTLNSSTIGAFPAILTSTRPLAFGGFDRGVFNRPVSLGTQLAANGYRSSHLATVHWVNSRYGYVGQGVDELGLVHPGSIAKTGDAPLGHLLRRLADGDASEALAADACRELRRHFEGIRCYLDAVDPAFLAQFPNSMIAQQALDLGQLRADIDAELAVLRSDPSVALNGMVHAFAKHGSSAFNLGWRRYRSRSSLTRAAVRSAAASAIKPVAPSVATRLLHATKPHPDASDLVDAVLRQLETPRNGQPAFVWAHLFDTHIPFTAGSGTGWQRDLPQWLERAGHSRTVDLATSFGPKPKTDDQWRDWSALYDAAVAFVGAQIGRLRYELNRRGLGNTLLVLSADHGEELGEHGDNSHRFRLYEHNVRIPILFNHPDLRAAELPGFASTLDIAPTICELLSVPSASGWTGQPLTAASRVPQQEVLFETFFGSPCAFGKRPLYLALRRADWKLHLTEGPEARDPLCQPGIRLFDLSNDQGEQNNVASARPDIAATMVKVLERRRDALLRENAGEQE
jgi:arylsulfatase A-like enzyme